MNSHRSNYIVHVWRYSLKEVSIPLLQFLTIQQKRIFCIQFRNRLADFFSSSLKIPLFYICKRHIYDRVCSLKFSVFRVFPNGKILKQIASLGIIYRKKLLYHTHIQCLSKTAWASNQCNTVPPFLNERCFINIEKFFSIISL